MEAGCGRIDTVHHSGWPQHCSLTVEVAVVDDMPGTHETSPHDAMCFVKTLTLRVPDGLAGPARARRDAEVLSDQSGFLLSTPKRSFGAFSRAAAP